MADAPDIPEELRAIFATMTDKLTDELCQAWLRGVCDGLDYAARGVEAVLHNIANTEPDERLRAVLTGTIQGLRQGQLAVAIDGIEIVGDREQD